MNTHPEYSVRAPRIPRLALMVALSAICTFEIDAQVSTNARTGRFTRGTGTDATYQSMVLALDFQKGVPLDNIGGNSTNWRPGVLLSTLYHYNATNLASATSTNGRIAYQPPIAAFGSRMGGTPLYVGTQYRFGAAVGYNAWGTNNYAMLYVDVYDKRSDYAWVGGTPFFMPRKDNTNDWTAFSTNGYSMSTNSWGLRTTVLQQAGFRWGLDEDRSDAYLLTHEGIDNTATNYLFRISALGYSNTNGVDSFAMSLNAGGTDTWTYVYSIEFDVRPTSRILFLDQPHFQGQPLPPAYAGKTTEELTNFTATITNQIWITNNANYFSLDSSPELRQHPILDKFVADMRYDPLALTEFVLNEIKLTDGLASGESGYAVAQSINLGGLNRSALGTFLERQGSPWEQCALLIYLLRAAGQPAAYVFPTNNNLKMLDTRLSKLLRMQLKGAVDYDGTLFTTNSLITVNYPWVVANINSNRVVHIFPWLKDTEVVEGLNLYDYMPTNYDSGYKWSRQYMFGDTNILGLSSETDVPRVLFPKFIERTLLSNYPGISIDDLGTRVFDRRHSYPRWEDLPKPTVLSNQTQVAVISNLVAVSNVLAWMKTPFDTARVQLLRSNTNLLDTGFMRTADLNARKFLLYTNAGKLTLWLASYRPSITATSTFGTNDPTFLKKQVVQTNVLTGDTNLTVRVTYLRQLSLTAAVPSFGLIETRQITNEFTYSKASVAGICINLGQVTPQMLQPHVEAYWAEERKKQTNSNHVPLPEDYQGTAAYLIGMGFHEKCSRFQEVNERLNKIRAVSSCSLGLGNLTTKVVTNTNKIQPVVDMTVTFLIAAANSTLHPDSEVAFNGAGDNFYWLLGVNRSAEEHAILNTSFAETNAVSTVRLLQLAQNRSTTNRAGIVELHKYNYISRGNQTSSLYSATTKLKDYDPWIWAQVTNAFYFGDQPYYTTVFITPASITNDNGSYKGMGAFIFDWLGFASLISANKNGGFGSDHPYFGVPASSMYLDWSLHRDSDGSSYFVYNSSGQNQLFTSVPTADVPTYFANDSTAIATPEQDEYLAWARNMLNLPGSSTFAESFRADRDAGLFGRDDWLRDRLTFSSDPVQALSGEFYIDAVDLTVPALTPLQIRRSYLSQNRSPGHFGVGWKLSYTPHLIVTTNAGVPLIYAAEPEGSVIAYRSQTNGTWLATVTDNPGLNNNSAQGIGSVHNILNGRIVQTNGTNYTLTGPDGSVRRYETRSYPIATNSSGALYRTRPYLVEWKDSQSNAYNFFYGSDQSRVDWGELVRVESSNGAFLGFGYDTYSRIMEAWTADGRRVAYEYDSFGDLIKVTLPDMAQIEYEYQHYTFTANSKTNLDSKHLLVKEFKPDGRVLQNEYDNQRRVTNQWSTVGPDLTLIRSASLVYSNNFNLTNMPASGLSGNTWVKDAYNATIQYGYTNGLITNITDAIGLTVQQVWYTNNAVAPGYPRSLQKVKDKRGLWTEYKYDTNGNVTSAVITGDLTGNGNISETATNTFSYNANNLLTNSVDPFGNKTDYVYDSTYPYLRQKVISYGGATAVATNFFEYYAVTNQVTNGTHIYTNIGLGLLRTEIRAYGSSDAATNEWTHDGRGFPTQHVRYTGTTDPAITNYFVYNGRGELEETTDGIGRKTRTDRDALSRPILREVYEANASVPLAWEYSYYNENGELVWSDGPRSNPEDYVWCDYDGHGRKCVELRWRSQAKADGSGVEAVNDNLFATSFFDYDYADRLTRVTDPRGVITTNIYDAIDRLIKTMVLDTNGTWLTTNSFAYEPGGQVAFHTNSLGGVTEKQYTSTGKLKYQTNVDGSTIRFTYYLDGRPQKKFLSNSNYLETLYDDANLRITNIFKNVGGTALATTISEFDRRGNVIRTVDAAGISFTNIYDRLDRVKSWSGPEVFYDPPNSPGSPGTPLKVRQNFINYYTSAGQVLTNVNALGEKAITYFDALRRTTRVEIRDAAGTLARETTIAYAADHHSVTTTNGAGTSAIVSTVFTDTQGKPVLEIGYPASNVRRFSRNEYDVAGNLTVQTLNSATNSSLITWQTATFNYDGLNRLRKKTDRDSAVTQFDYNALGKETNRVMPGGLTWRARYNNAGQIMEEYDISGSTGANTNTYAYYTNGAFAGRLQTKTDGRGVACTYTYDEYLRVATNACSGTTNEHNLTFTWKYDVRGQLTNVTQRFATNAAGPVTSVHRTYDAYGLIRFETVLLGAIDGIPVYSMMQGWDSAGRRMYYSADNVEMDFTWRADGLLTDVKDIRSGANGGSYTYDTAGVLLSRSVFPRLTTILQRDGMGRSLLVTNSILSTSMFTETLGWTGDGLLATQSRVSTNMTDNASYFYADQSRRLTQERLNVSNSKRWTNSFTYDGGSPSGAGVLTKAGDAPASWRGGTNSLLRIVAETNDTIRWPAWGTNNGNATVSAFLDGVLMPTTQIGTTQKLAWRTTLDLTPGTHELRVQAVHPSGLYTAYATNSFTNSSAGETISDTYDASGQITSRVWKIGSTTNRTQTLTWDAVGRLLKVVERDNTQSGFNWTADYDPFGRRIRATETAVTNGSILSQAVLIEQRYDPEVPFMEVGVVENGILTWKLYGPDLNGVYGGLKGVGGFEAIIPRGEVFCPLIADSLGNLQGIYEHANFEWFPSRSTAYGAVPGYRPVALGHVRTIAHASAWRGKYGDIHGTISLGVRNLHWDIGKFWSRDPLGHDADIGGYEFANGDPVNYFDADGFCADSTAQRYPDAPTLTEQIDYWNRLFGAQRAAQEASDQWLAARANRERSTAQSADQLADSIVAAGQRQANQEWAAKRLAGVYEPGLSWLQQWEYHPTEQFEKSLKTAAEVSLMFVPFGTTARAAEVGFAAERALLRGGAEMLGPPSLMTESGQALFWSGLGRGGSARAAEVAGTRGGATLEMLVEGRGLQMPPWNAANPASVAAWRDASAVFARGASGDVRVVLGDSLRPGSLWESVELPALRANQNVNKIITINPSTGAETTIFHR